MTFDALLETWYTRVRRAQVGHFQSAVRCERQHLWIGLPAVILSTVVGSSVFASLQKGASVEMGFLVAFLSILAAILASVQTFLRHTERAERHRLAGTAFGALKKELELKRVIPPKTPEDQEKYMTDFLERWNRLVENSPTTDETIFQKMKSPKMSSIDALGSNPGAQPRPAADT
jgi:hypothetical protein